MVNYIYSVLASICWFVSSTNKWILPDLANFERISISFSLFWTAVCVCAPIHMDRKAFKNFCGNHQPIQFNMCTKLRLVAVYIVWWPNRLLSDVSDWMSDDALLISNVFSSSINKIHSEIPKHSGTHTVIDTFLHTVYSWQNAIVSCCLVP